MQIFAFASLDEKGKISETAPEDKVETSLLHEPGLEYSLDESFVWMRAFTRAPICVRVVFLFQRRI